MLSADAGPRSAKPAAPTDHLDAARGNLANAHANQHISSIARVATELATAHALVDIAESLRILRPPPPDPNVRTFGGKPVRIVPLKVDNG